MRGERKPSLYFLTLPDLRKLCRISSNPRCDHSSRGARNKQLKTCRELILKFPDVVASPVLESSEIIVVMSVDFFKTGVIQAYMQRHDIQTGALQQVLPGHLQTCLSYTITTRLAPNWNLAGQFLIAGEGFLTHSGKQNAIVMELSAWEGQLCVSLEGRTVRLPPPTLEEFDVAPNVTRNFATSKDAVIQGFSIPNNWCYVLPSMKQGQIMRISHQPPPDCPFQSYVEMRQHWKCLYGYELPHVAEKEVVYCSVRFQMVGVRLFTYPLSCIRTQPIQLFPRTDQQGALSSFLLDLKNKLQNVCGFPAQVSTKPCYYTAGLITSGSQDFSTRPLNLTSMNSDRSVLMQLPKSCPQVSSLVSLPLSPSTSWYRDHQGRGMDREHQTASTAAHAGVTKNVRPSSTAPAAVSTLSQPVQMHSLQSRTLEVFVSKALTQQTGSREHRSEVTLVSSSMLKETDLVPSPAPDPASLSSRRLETHRGRRQSCQLLMPQCLPPSHPTEECPPPWEELAGERYKSRLKRLKPSIREEDVKNYARSSQETVSDVENMSPIHLKCKSLDCGRKPNGHRESRRILHRLSQI
ncbi:uncharacterized protein C18orf63 homolog isoform X1 [Scleropages formosus]|uniref:uncharacterized protein C18orf63 homolog isoform X1 n=2 Tax=Scleropages formosus TaxID=113540 RepID=UPI0010FA9019|nr:uncharacterized protein C18orf63 homolog isoform X1 [Scleropages formosus]XP_018621234.2 uncharacterized protein C18orf63 homolog isoform X1 [Scleropages formosus]XP_029107995.1 uncharacterized protein C18orf63 homolog isoform X1 [Scleropages formosus]